MSFNYTLTPPCSSAQPVKDENGEIIIPMRYDGVGCPGIINTNYKINCNNGKYIGKSNLEYIDGDLRIKDGSCNGNVDYEIVGSNCQNYNPMVYEDTELVNIFNSINFIRGQKVFVENIKSGLESLLSQTSLTDFYDWNQPNNLEDILNNLTSSCGITNMLYGRIVKITNGSFRNGSIDYYMDGIKAVSLNRDDKWPSEIFWLELINAGDFGLNNFNVSSMNNSIIYTEDGIQNVNIHSSSPISRKLLFPVLREQITNLRTRLSIQSSNNLNRSQIMNTPRFRSRGSCATGSLCLDTTLTPSFKNSTKNMYLAPIPYAQRIGNTFRSSLVRGTKKIIRRNCVNPQFGRIVGTGGPTLVNKF